MQTHDKTTTPVSIDRRTVKDNRTRLLQGTMSMISRRTLTLMAALAAMFASAAMTHAQVIYVDADAVGANDGSSWANAFTDLQSALAIGNSSNEIWVAEGTYRTSAVVNPTAAFDLYNGARLYGGFSATEATLAERAGLFSTTILSGDVLGNDPPDDPDQSSAARTDNTFNVVYAGPSVSNIVLDGFTIEGANCPDGCEGGGGLSLDNAGGVNDIRNCTFTNNASNAEGGGVSMFGDSTTTFTKCVFRLNSADLGGGLFLLGGTANLVMDHCLVADNNGPNEGGGIYVDFFGIGTATFRNCTIANNAALEGSGGGLSVLTSQSLTIENSIIANNVSGNEPTEDQIVFEAFSNNYSFSHTLIQGFGNQENFPGVVGTNPMFTNAAAGDYTLTFGSPGIDAGDNSLVTGGITTDLAGNVRFTDDTGTADTGSGTVPIVDMGAFEFQGTTSAPQIVYVDADALGADNGTSWANAYDHIQDALANLNPTGPTEIWVADGTYYPDDGTGQVNDDRTATFQLTSLTQLYGGFNGTEMDRNDRDPEANLTILSGDIEQNDDLDCKGQIPCGNNSYHVVTAPDANPSTVLDGFFVTGGYADGIGSLRHGAGLYAPRGSLTVNNCDFFQNSAEDNNQPEESLGGGVFLFHAPSAAISRCRFASNSAARGAGLYSEFSGVTVTNSEFSDNFGDFGVGAYITDPFPIDGLLFSNVVTNCTFADNRAIDGGTVGAGLWTNGYTTVQNSIFYHNSYLRLSEGILAPFTPEEAQIYVGFFFTEFTLLEKEIEIRNCIIQELGKLDVAEWNNSAEDPLFFDIDQGSGNGGTFDDLRFPAGSPAIDAGVDANVPADATSDLFGNPRLVDDTGVASANTVDLGSYEFQGTTGTKVIYVDGDVLGGNQDGTSWANAYPNLRSAIAEGSDPDNITQIWVAQGMYDTIDGPGDVSRGATFFLNSRVSIYGGFTGNEQFLEERDPEENETVLSGARNGTGNSYHVVTCNGMNSSAVLDGFTIQDGTANGPSGNSDDIGAGLIATSCRATIRNCRFQGLAASGNGGAVHARQGSAMTFEGCTFIGNDAGFSEGGAIFAQADIAPRGMTISACSFRGNNALEGGGVYTNGVAPIITNSEFIGNTAGDGGAGVSMNESPSDPFSRPAVVNCTFALNNPAPGVYGSGSGLRVNLQSTEWLGSEVTLANTIFWENGGTAMGSQFFKPMGGGDIDFYNNLIQGGTPFFLDMDPMFFDADGADDIPGNEDDNVSLLPMSPAIDAGTNTEANALALTTDITGGTRFRDDEDTPDTGVGTAPIVDIGAYEFNFAFGLGDELPPPTNPGFVIDPSPEGGTGLAVGSEGKAFYHPVEGKWYAIDRGPIDIEWFEAEGGPGMVTTQYIVGPVVNPDNPRTRLVRYFPNYGSAKASFGGESPVVHYNSLITPDCNSDMVPDFLLQAGIFEIQDTACLPGFGQDPRFIALEYNEPGSGRLLGFEIVFIERVAASIHSDPLAQTDFLIPVGRRIPEPDPLNQTYTRAVLATNMAVTGPAAWQNIEQGGVQSTIIYPIRPQLGTFANLATVWYRETTVADRDNPSISVPLGEWPIDVTRYRSDWPENLAVPGSQTNVIDPSGTTPVVDLRTDLYSTVEVMYEELFNGNATGESYPQQISEFVPVERALGYSVLKFECEASNLDCDVVTFEVLRTYDHRDIGPVGDEVFDGSNPRMWDVGTSIEQPSLHAPTSRYPFGYLHEGLPYAPCIYNESGLDCELGEATGQIIPVNISNIGGTPEHGLLEVWFFEEGRTIDATGGNFAAGVQWPHVVQTYELQWPATPCVDPVGDAGGCDQLIIASRLGQGKGGLGLDGYGPEASIYKVGQVGDDLNTQATTPGWNPNDEHASLISIGGGRLAYATRDDNPWEYNTGHPYVLVQHWDSMNEKWAMDVTQVVAEVAPLTFNYTDLVSVNPATMMLDFTPVTAGLPLNPPLFPLNFNILSDTPCNDGTEPLSVLVKELECEMSQLPCQSAYDCNVCSGGSADTLPCASDLDCPGGTCPGEDCIPTGALWPDRTQQLWTINDLSGTVELFELWGQDGDDECQAYLPEDMMMTDPQDIIYDPQWPADCPGPNPCALSTPIGSTLDQSAACSLDILHDDAGVKIIDPNFEVSVDFAELAPDFKLLPPHLAGGRNAEDGTFPDDRISSGSNALTFKGIMSDDDHATIKALSNDTVYQTAIDSLRDASRVQLGNAFDPITEPSFGANVVFTDENVSEGYVTVARNNDLSCAVNPVEVQVLNGSCPPAGPPVQNFSTACPFGETVVLRVNHDIIDFPNALYYQWQFRETGMPTWQNWHNSDAEALGTRELQISGSNALTDKEFRVRYRGFSACPCGGTGEPVCTTVGTGEDDWPDWASASNDGTAVSEWSNAISMQGWLKRLVEGLNPFDERLSNLHDAEGLNFTYLTMIENAGQPFDGTAILSCSPSNLQSIGLIEAYSSAKQRAEAFTVAQRPATDPENLAILFITGKVADLYMLLANEAFADATDPTTGVDSASPFDPVALPSALYAFEGEVGSPLDEELSLLRGTDLDQGFPLHNRLRWNFGPLERAEAAYVSTYNLVDKDGDGFIQLSDATITFPQGHGDAWGHFLSSMKLYYNLLRTNNFEWIIATETIPSGTGSSTPVRYQYERRFAQSAASKARAGAAIVDLTFRQSYNADPTDDPGYPDSNSERAWGLAEWSRRAGQGAYFDWVTANALLDDDDSGNTGLERVDRTTVPELQEIASAYYQIQAAMTNAGNGVNPLGLAANVVPFGINAEALDEGTSHYEQVRCWAAQQLDNAATLFDYANDNIRRLRTNEDDANDFAVAVGEEESDFTARLIEIYGRPYPESIGIPGGYPAGYEGPDIFFFDYIDPSSLLGETDFTSDAFTTQITRTFTDYDGLFNEDPTTNTTIDVTFNASTAGLGLVKPQGWSVRPEPGEIQLAKVELLQAVGELQQAIEVYEAHLDNIDAEVLAWSDLTQTNSNILNFQTGFQTTEQNLNSRIALNRTLTLVSQQVAENALIIGDAVAEGVPEVFGLANSAGSPAKGVAKFLAGIGWNVATTSANIFEVLELASAQDLEEAATALEIDITREAQSFDEDQQLRVIEQLIRETPAIRLSVFQQAEAIRQAEGRYLQAIGEGGRLLDQRALFRTRFASTATDFRYKDLTFRLLRNESLQKYRAMFDLAARYVFLAAQAYDYETNLLGSDAESARGFLASIVKQRTLGVVPDNLACDQPLPPPVAPNGLADLLGSLDQQFQVIRQNRFVGDINRSFKLRRQLFRVVGDDEDAWKAALARAQVNDLNDDLDYRLFASQLQGFSGENAALVIPFSTTVNEGLNFFGWRINGPDFPSGRYAVKLKSFSVYLHGLPPELNPFVDAFLLPVGSDIMRTPQGSAGANIRVWNLLDQTLPPPQPIGGSFVSPDWVPWDTWTAAGIPGDPRLAVQRRRLPSIGACDPTAVACDVSTALVGRSVWNTRWKLIIPGSSLSNKVPPAEAIDTFINGNGLSEGVSDIELVFNAVGYDLNTAAATADAEPAEGIELELDVKPVAVQVSEPTTQVQGR